MNNKSENHSNKQYMWKGFIGFVVKVGDSNYVQPNVPYYNVMDFLGYVQRSCKIRVTWICLDLYSYKN